MKIRTKTKSTRIEGRGQQFCDYTEHLTMSQIDTNSTYEPHMLRIVIHLGGHKVQSHGVIERWNGEEWKQVAWLSGHALMIDVRAGYDYKKTLSNLSFEADRDTLIRLAREVLK